MHWEIGVTQGQLGYVYITDPRAPSCLWSHNAQYIMLKPLLYNGSPCICGYQGSFYHGNGSILSLWSLLNHEKQLFWCKFSYVNNHLYLVINFNHIKLRYIEPCNFLTKRALVSQQSTLVVAKDPNISHYLNLPIYLPTIILAII